MRPQGRAEPGIEHVGVLNQGMAWPQLVAAQVGLGADEPAARLRLPPGHVGAAAEGAFEILLRASSAVPDGNPMSPPELAADAPVALLAQPVEIALGVALGVNRNAARRDGVHRLLGKAGAHRSARRPCARTTGPTDTARSASCSGPSD